MADGRFVAYYRVSTAQQGRSGLGLDAQRNAVREFLNGGSWTLSGEFTEIESGKNNDRPQLALAMNQARLIGATLVIAKLDRLSRDAHFLLGLSKAGVDFVAADMPNANRLTVGIMAVVADEERRMISTRTRAALAAAKARGTKLGGYRGGPVVDAKLGGAAVRVAADSFASRVAPTITQLRHEGLSLAAVANKLTSMDVRTARGGAWTSQAVKNALERISEDAREAAVVARKQRRSKDPKVREAITTTGVDAYEAAMERESAENELRASGTKLLTAGAAPASVACRLASRGQAYAAWPGGLRHRIDSRLRAATR